MSLDGKGVVMRVEGLKPETRKKAKIGNKKLQKRLSPGEKRNAKRMGTVAAIYTVDPYIRTPEEVATPPKKEERRPAPRPLDKRVWASLERPMKQVITEMFDEAFCQDPLGEKQWVCLTDGNPTQIRLVKERAAVDKCANYLLKLGDYLRYDQYLKLGLPIASGVIEGACRHLIKDRMDVTGARWSLPGAEAVLKLRALLASGDFDAYWAFHEAMELKRNHTSHYADNVVPFKRPEGRDLHQCAV